MPCSRVMEAFTPIVLFDKFHILETGQPYHQPNIYSCRKLILLSLSPSQSLKRSDRDSDPAHGKQS
jgi:hypothetical protein